MWVWTHFSGKSHRGTAWPGDAGFLGRGRRRAGLPFSSALRCPRISPERRGKRRDWSEETETRSAWKGPTARELLAITITYYLHYGMHYCIITIRYNLWCATIMFWKQDLLSPRIAGGGGALYVLRGGISPVLRAFSTCYRFNIFQCHITKVKKKLRSVTFWDIVVLVTSYHVPFKQKIANVQRLLWHTVFKIMQLRNLQEC